MQIVSGSRGTAAFSREGGTGSWDTTCRNVSAAVSAWNGMGQIADAYGK
jgi:hypothetical protein